MEQPKLEALLGRSLSAIEAKNYDLYLDIAKESLEQLLCISLDVSEEDAVATPRLFPARKDFSTVFTGIFHDVSEVKLDGDISDTADYYAAQWDNRNGAWFNSIVFNDLLDDEEVEVTAIWGFTVIPDDLLRLWAQLFALTGKKYQTQKVASKRVEDFHITFTQSLTDEEQFTVDNRRVLSKYRLCDVGAIRHG